MFVYIYIYIHICTQVIVFEGAPKRNSGDITGVCEKNTPPENGTRWNISFQSTKSGAGEVSAAGLQGQGSHNCM